MPINIDFHDKDVLNRQIRQNFMSNVNLLALNFIEPTSKAEIYISENIETIRELYFDRGANVDHEESFAIAKIIQQRIKQLLGICELYDIFQFLVITHENHKCNRTCRSEII